jgi:hypothetical protein
MAAHELKLRSEFKAPTGYTLKDLTEAVYIELRSQLLTIRDLQVTWRFKWQFRGRPALRIIRDTTSEEWTVRRKEMSQVCILDLVDDQFQIWDYIGISAEPWPNTAIEKIQAFIQSLAFKQN